MVHWADVLWVSVAVAEKEVWTAGTDEVERYTEFGGRTSRFRGTRYSLWWWRGKGQGQTDRRGVQAGVDGLAAQVPWRLLLKKSTAGRADSTVGRYTGSR